MNLINFPLIILDKIVFYINNTNDYYNLRLTCRSLYFIIDNVKRFYSNGIIKELFFIKNNTVNGYYLKWYKNNNPEKIYFFINNKKEGINKIFYENRKIKKTINYKNNLKNGIEKNYDANGTIIKIINYFDNEKFFEHIFNKRMLLFSKFYYNPNYFSIKKYNNRNIVIEGEFLNNKLHNKLIIYFENKKLIYKYNKGELISKYEFDNNNNLIEKINYKNNVKNGLAYNYYSNNKLKSIKYFKNNNLLKMNSWSINHLTQKNINFENNIINGDYKIIGNYIDYILPYKNGKLDGFVIINYKLLRCKVMIKYINNEFANIYKKIIKNNNKKIEIIISSNYLSYTKYYNNGNKHIVLKKKNNIYTFKYYTLHRELLCESIIT